MDIDKKIEIIIKELKLNQFEIRQLYPLDSKKISHLENIIKFLNDVKNIFYEKSIDFSRVSSFQHNLKNLIKGRSVKITQEQFVSELQNIILTLDSLRSSKDIEIIGKGLETVVKGVNMYIFRDKVIKKLFETTDKKFLDDYLMRVKVYIQRMNNIHPNFRLWPTEIKVIKKRIYIGSPESNLYIVYAIQKRFEAGFTLRNQINLWNKDEFLNKFNMIIQIALNIILSNHLNDTKVAADFDCANLILIGNTFYYFDYNNPFLKIGNENYGEMEKIWDEMQKVNKRTFITKAAFFTVVKIVFNPESFVEKVANNLFFSYKLRNKELKNKMELIIKEQNERIKAINTSKIKISRTTFLFKHGGISGYIPFFQRKA